MIELMKYYCTLYEKNKKRSVDVIVKNYDIKSEKN